VFSHNTPPPREGCKKENWQQTCDGELYRRPDDEPETQKNRIRVYNEQTAPLIEFYTQRGVLAEINGEQNVKAVQESLLDAVQGKTAVVSRQESVVSRQNHE
jgi:adenylate kinase